MHPYLAGVFSRMDISRACLRAAVDSVPEALRATRPEPDRRSVAEVLEHHRFGALDLYQWVEFIAGHEGRHVQQILEAAGQLQPREH